MFGLFYLAWLALILALVGFFSRNLIRWFREPETRRESLSKLVVLFACLAFVTWPFLLGRVVYSAKCRFLAGLRITQTVDLRDDGYLIWPEAYDHPERGDAGRTYDHQALQDLLTGRIAFFERPVLTWGPGGPQSLRHASSYLRFALGSSRGLNCVNTADAEEMLRGLRLAAGQCITRTESRDARAGYRLRIGKDNSSTELLDQVMDRSLAIFRSYSHWSGLTADAGSLTYHCPSQAEYFDYAPQKGLSAFVSPDRDGRVVTVAELPKWRETVRELGYYGFAELPPHQITMQPVIPSASTCSIESFPRDIESIRGAYHLHIVSTSGGNGAVQARLDGSQSRAGQIEVLVNMPAQPVVLLLMASEPVVWHISRTTDSHIAAVLVRGGHGQAVLGIERSVPLRINTSSHSPGSNCYPTEFGQLQAYVERNSASTSKSVFDPPRGARLVIVGDKIPDRSRLVYSADRSLEEFTMDLPAIPALRAVPYEPLLYSPDP